MTFLSGLKAKLRLDGRPVMRRAPSDLDTINEAGDGTRTSPTGCPFRASAMWKLVFFLNKNKNNDIQKAQSPTSCYVAMGPKLAAETGAEQVDIVT